MLSVFTSAEIVNKPGWKLASESRAFRFYAFVMDNTRKSEHTHTKKSQKLEIEEDGPIITAL